MTTITLPKTRSPGRRAEWANLWLRWGRELPEEPPRPTVADVAECICPDLCNRDHENE
jgi:hypothetical protein